MDSTLVTAARQGDLDSIQDHEKVEVSNIFRQTTHNGNTLLHMAARFGKKNVVEYIMKQDPSVVLACNNSGETPVHVAARAGHEGIVCMLMQRVKQHGDVRIARVRDKSGNTPLHGAVRNNKLQVVRVMAKEDRESLTLVNNAGESALSIAIDQRLSSISKEILGQNPATINYRGPNGQTPLHFAVHGQDSVVMGLILDLKGDLIRSLDEKKRNPLHYAAAFGRQQEVKELLKKNTSIAYQRDHNGQAPIHLASKQGKLGVLKALLDPCPDSIELLDNKRRNILHIAADNGNSDIVSHILSLEESSDLINSTDSDGNTPLHLAAKNFHSRIVSALCRNRTIEIRAINKSNETALTIVDSSEDHGMELQQHLTMTALKRAIKKRSIDPEDILEQGFDNEEKKRIKRGQNTREVARTLSVIATLVATFTFTAAFTLPGGFRTEKEKEGTAVLLKDLAFKIFILSDVTAMTSSVSASILIVWASSYRDCEFLMDMLPSTVLLIWIGLVSMAAAFVAGLFAVVSDVLWLAITICVIGGVLPAYLYLVCPWNLIFDHGYKGSQVNLMVQFRRNNPFLLIGRFIKKKFRNRARVYDLYLSRSSCMQKTFPM